jgi:GTP-binding protein EngB required for normal cell division
MNTSLTSLGLTNQYLDSSDAITIIVEALNLKSNTTLKTLILDNTYYNSLKLKGVISIGDALKTNITLTTLDLGGSEIFEAEEVVIIANALKVNSTLRSLNLTYCNLKSSGLTIIGGALILNTTLNTLILRSNHIGTNIDQEGPSSIVDFLKISSTLTALDISYNELNEKGAISIANALSMNTTLKSLNISSNSIQKSGIRSICDALLTNSSLTFLDLSRNDINDIGMSAISKLLANNTTLTSLLIHNIEMNENKVISIIDALMLNTTLTSLNISNGNLYGDVEGDHRYLNNVPKEYFKKLAQIIYDRKNNNSLFLMKIDHRSLYWDASNTKSKKLNGDQIMFIVIQLDSKENKFVRFTKNREEYQFQYILDYLVLQLEQVERERKRKEKIKFQKLPLYCVIDINNIFTFNKYNNINDNHNDFNNNNPTIVLIGTNGVGKSTFGNWLFNYGLSGIKVDNFIDVKEKNDEKYSLNSKSKPFITSSDKFNSTECCTDKVELYSFSNYNIIDTPGLNDPNDFENMERLTEFLKEVNNLSAIILCLPFNLKFDDPTIDTIKYYEKLFKPIFNNKQVIIVFTKVDKEDYLILKEEEEWEDSIEIKLKQLNKKFNCDFNIGYAFNTIYKKEDILNEIMNEKKSDNLIGTSMRNRDMILTIIKSFQPITEIQTLFSLPPTIERKRINMLNESFIVSLNILEILGEDDNKDKVKLLNKYNEYSNEHNEKEKEKRKLEV